jgi:hypothetical protein
MSLHSPARRKTQDQFREILGDYGPIAGLWLDVYRGAWPATDDYTARAFEAWSGVAADDATPAQGATFVHQTLVDYADELHVIASELEPGLQVTYNGSAQASLGRVDFAQQMLQRMDYLSSEGHRLDSMYEQAAGASYLIRPMETGNLVSSTWFTPPPPLRPDRARQALAECAAAWCQGANTYIAISPQHDGTYAGEMEIVERLGEWLRDRQEILARSEPWRDIGIVVGAPAPSYQGGVPGRAALDLYRSLGSLGYGVEQLYALDEVARWPRDLSEFDAIIVPDVAPLDDDYLSRLRRYVRRGGELLFLGRGGHYDALGQPRAASAIHPLTGELDPRRIDYRAGTGSRVAADSAFGLDYVPANVVDGTSASWASTDTPMPHWVEIELPDPGLVGTIRVTGRRGPFLLQDVDILVRQGDEWVTVGTYRDNEAPNIDCALEPPRRAKAVRVLVLRESYRGQPRDVADIEEIQVLSPEGELLSPMVEPMYEIEAHLDDGHDLMATGPAFAASAWPADVLASFTSPLGSRHPLLARRRMGRGGVSWCALDGSPLAESGPVLEWVAEGLAGPPTVSGHDPDRHLPILRRVDEGLVACLIDIRPDEAPVATEIRVAGGEGESFAGAAPLGSGDVVRSSVAEGEVVVELHPDPVATVLVR